MDMDIPRSHSEERMRVRSNASADSLLLSMPISLPSTSNSNSAYSFSIGQTLHPDFRPFVVYVYRNGDTYAPATEVSISRKRFMHWVSFLDYLTSKCYMPRAVNHLYTTTGAPVRHFKQLADGGEYVCANGAFKRVNYGGTFSRLANFRLTPKSSALNADPSSLDSLESREIYANQLQAKARRMFGNSTGGNGGYGSGQNRSQGIEGKGRKLIQNRSKTPPPLRYAETLTPTSKVPMARSTTDLRIKRPASPTTAVIPSDLNRERYERLRQYLATPDPTDPRRPRSPLRELGGEIRSQSEDNRRYISVGGEVAVDNRKGSIEKMGGSLDSKIQSDVPRLPAIANQSSKPVIVPIASETANVPLKGQNKRRFAMELQDNGPSSQMVYGRQPIGDGTGAGPGFGTAAPALLRPQIPRTISASKTNSGAQMLQDAEDMTSKDDRRYSVDSLDSQSSFANFQLVLTGPSKKL